MTTNFELTKPIRADAIGYDHCTIRPLSVDRISRLILKLIAVSSLRLGHWLSLPADHRFRDFS